MNKIKIVFKSIIFVFLTSIILITSIYFYNKESVVNIYFRISKNFYLTYENDKAKISPYFDEKFYKTYYAKELKESKQEPIDHFLQRSGHFLGGDFDPNPWFNTLLYQERLWPCKGNAFVDFLNQPSQKLPENAKGVEVYANQHQLYRAWMAVEGFMRMNKFHVYLVLPASFKDNIPICFEPIIKRGLKVKFSDDPKLSFYHSPFLTNPDAYQITDMPAVESAPTDRAMTRYKRQNGYEYIMHRFYNYTKWQKYGKINPCMLNYAHYCFEPIEFCAFGKTPFEFKKSMQRLAPGFDMMFLNSNIGTKNLRIVPGFMFSFVNEQDIPQKKNYSISLLLSLGGKGFDSFKTRGAFIYHYRQIMWDYEPRIPLNTHFYLSRRDLKKYPLDMQNRVLPTDSKKWIFESQFNIAIENVIQEDYFSEKLLGCFITLTVPIYIGCPNIKDYFDERGILIAKDPEDIVRITQSLTPETYQKMLPYLIENKKRAEKLINLEEHYITEFFEKEMR